MINRGVKMGRRDSRPDTRTIAFHEAGHAVIAVKLDLEIEAVTIDPVKGSGHGEGFLGCTFVNDPLLSWRRGDGPRRPLMESYVVTLFAGCAAEGVLHGREQEVDGLDDAKAQYWLRQFPPSRCGYIGDSVFERYVRKLKRRADELVKYHFAEIRTIAELLLERKKLRRNQILEALGMQAAS
jgi:ATP-dependent Zn protease